jgi:hypothetical protein
MSDAPDLSGVALFRETPPVASACAWRREETGGDLVNLFIGQDSKDGSEGSEAEVFLDPSTARALAAQLLAAADLVDAAVRNA